MTWLLVSVLYAITVKAATRQDVIIGTNIVNPYALSDTEQNMMLSRMKADGVRTLRVSITLDDKGIAFAERVARYGIKMDWLIYRFGGFAPGGKPLSAADAEEFRRTFSPVLAALEQQGITLVAFELGNEFNLAGYNSEFPRPSRGYIFGLNDLTHDPEAEQVGKGYLQYLKVLSVLKDVRDRSKLNQQTPILSGGLAVYENDDGPLQKGMNTDLVSANSTLVYLRANGLDDLVDGYAVHVYPRGNAPGDPAAAAARKEGLAKYAFKQCRAAGVNGGKPCWLTEWGFNNADSNCPIDDAARTSLVQEMMGDFRPYVRDGRLVALLSYAWNDVPGVKTISPLTLFRCGSLTPSGKVSIDSRLLH